MWVKLEDKLEYINLKNMSSIEVSEHEGKHRVGLCRGFSFSTLRSFEYKEDAEKYLDKLIERLEGDDDEDE